MYLNAKVERVTLANLAANLIGSTTSERNFLFKRFQVVHCSADDSSARLPCSAGPPQRRAKKFVLVGVDEPRSDFIEPVFLLMGLLGYPGRMNRGSMLASLRWARSARC